MTPKLTPFIFTALVLVGFAFPKGAIAQTTDQQKVLAHIKDIGSSDTVIAYVDKQIRLAQSKHDKLYEAHLIMAKSFTVYTKGDELGALELARKAKDMTPESDSATYIKSRTMIAYMLSRHGKHVDAFRSAFDALRKTDEMKWRKLGINARACLSDLYRTIDQPQKALIYATQGYHVAKQIRDTANIIFMLSTMANVYSSEQMHSPENEARASAYMDTILTDPLAKHLSFFEKARFLSNQGLFYNERQMYPEAEKALVQSIQMCREGKFSNIEQHALNELLTVRINQKKFPEAITIGLEALKLNDISQITVLQKKSFYWQFQRAYEGIGDYKNALRYYRMYADIKDSLNSTYKAAAIAEQAERYKRDKKVLQEQNNVTLAQQQRNFVILIAIGVFAAIFGLYRWLIYKRKKEAALLAKEHEQLARVDAMKSNFFANISHELRTPLTLIMGPVAQLMDDENLSDAERRRHLQTINRNSKKLLSTVNELLDLGKIEAGNLTARMQPVSLGNFISLTYQHFASAAEFKRIDYRLKNAIPADVFVLTDREKLEKVLNNLIGNAIKFTPTEGTVRVEASFSEQTLIFSVTDTAGGISEKDLPHIFERYYQGRVEVMPVEGGTGIGLAIAREYVELLGGAITVQSQLNKGSEFTITLPLQLTPALEPEVKAPAIAEPMAPAVTTAGARQHTIMLVEDHPEMIGYITSILAPNYHIITTYNGLEALSALKQATKLPDLIVSDVMMPGMDGFTLLGELKNDQRFCTIPLIMLTALADTGSRLQALQTGVDDYLTKPFVSAELKARVANLLGNAAGRGRVSTDELKELPPVKDDKQEPPLMIDPISVSPADLAWLAEVELLVRKHVGKTEFNLASLSYELSISERQLFRRIKHITGVTPNKYIRDIRLQVAREAIESGKYRTLAEISYIAGFETPAYFSKLFREHFGRDVSDLL